LPVPQEFKLSNGLTVLFNERPGLPVVAASLVLRSGSGANPADKPGLASFTARMLQQGTATRNALEIADTAADLGASLGSHASIDSSSVGTQVLTRNFPEALELLADVALHPTFPKDEIERVRKEREAALVQEKDDPFSVATRVMRNALYGAHNPYGYPDIGTADSLKSLSRQDLVKFWQEHYFPNDAAIIIAGNIKLATLKPLLEKAFGAWKPGQAVAAAPGTLEGSDARLILVDRPGAQQTTLECYELGAARTTPDYAPLEVVNTELGGLFSSRINMNLREAHGYTYGAGSTFAYHRQPGPFLAYSAVRTDVTAPAVTEIFNELRRMRDTQMTPEEMRLSKDSITRSMPGRFERGSDAVGTFAELFVYDLPLDYFSKFPDAVDTVSPQQAQTTAQKYIHPEKIAVVAVGDRSKIEDEMKKLNLGKMEVRDSDGKLVQ
jgi:zinc protease